MNPLRIRAAGLIITVACFVLGGCSNYRDPSIALGGSKVADVSDEALALKFSLDLKNPNNEPLKLLQFKYDVNIDGKRVYSGMRSAEATLASSSARQLEIPAVVRFADLGWNPGNPQSMPPHAQYSVSGTLEYITPGDIAQLLLDTGVRKPSVSFSGAGEVALSQPIAIPATEPSPAGK
jgi:hypothetical protein